MCSRRKLLGHDLRFVTAAVVLLTLGLPALGQGAEGEQSRLERLIGWLGDPDEGVRREGALLLGEIGPLAAAAVPSLVKALDDSSAEVRREVVSALERIGPPAAVPALVKALESPDGEVRCRAAESLGTIGSAAKAAVPSLSRALDDPRQDVRTAAATALGEIGSGAASAVPSLSRALGEAADMGCLEAAAESLGRIGGPAAVSALVHGLESPSEEVRERAARALGGDAPGDLPCPVGAGTAGLAIPALIQTLDDPARDVRAAAAEALGSARCMAESSVPALMRALDDPDILVRSTTAEALGKFGPAAAPAVPTLVEALDDADRGAPARAPLPLSGTEPGAVRRRAAQALGGIGPPAASAVPALVRALDDPVPEVRNSATWSLNTLGLDSRQKGVVLWWVVPWVYRLELIGLMLLIAVWFTLAARFPRRRPSSWLKQVAHFAFTAIVPTVLGGSATGYAVTREWARGFLPDQVLTVLPFPPAAVLSAGFVCTMAAVWVCWRKQPAAAEERREHA